MDVREEQLLAIERDPVRDADVAHGPAGACGTDRLHHRLLGTDALEHRVGADPVGQLLDARYAVVTAFGHDVSGAEFKGEILTRFMTAHRYDALGDHLPRRENTEEPDRAVADDPDQ